MDEEDAAHGRRWEDRPVRAALVRLAAFLLPVAASVAATAVLSRAVPRPAAGVAIVLWWAGLLVCSSVVLWIVDRLTRRLLPLAALLRLSLVFPDQAPARFKVALRSGTTSHLEERLKAGPAGLDAETPQEAAERVLELVGALNAHDRKTRGHSERVRAYTEMLAEELGLEEPARERLRWAALLHDVGKLAVPAHILNKRGKPDEDEWRALQRHPADGQALLGPLADWLGVWASAVGQHHERWDGRGYPLGLRGEDIAHGARIVAVADTFEVITAARSYKAAQSAEFAREEVARNAGTQFDPTVVRALLSVSIGKLRLVMGPLSWLAQMPVIGSLPIGPAIGTAVSAVSVVTGLVVGGLMPAGRSREDGGHGAARPAPAAEVQDPPPPSPPPEPDAPVPPGVAAPAPEPAEETPDEAPAPPVADPEPVPAAAPAPAPEVPPPPPEPLRLVVGTGPVVDEDAGAVVVPRWARASDGSTPDGSVTYTATSARPELFSAPPSIGADGSLSFTPAPDVSGTTAVTVEASGPGAPVGAAGGSVTIRPVADAPVAGDDALIVPEDTSGSVDLQANDSDADGDPLTSASATPPAAGQLDVDPAGTATYVPEPDRAGAEAAASSATDPGGLTDQAALSLVVQPQPDPPVAMDDAASTTAGTPLDLASSAVLANDTDPDGDPVTLATAIASPPSNGVLTYDAGTGTYHYVPNPGFSGVDRFTYAVTDGTATASATVVITVGPPPPEAGFRLGTSGSGPDDWDLVAGAPSPSAPVPDSDGDGSPGLTIEHSGGQLDEDDGRKYQNWSTGVAADLQLAGNANLELRSSLEGGLLSTAGHVRAYLQDCAPGAASTDAGAACQELASVDQHVDDWSLLPGFQSQSFDMGVVDATVPAGRSLRLKLLVQHKDTLVDPRGSQLVLNAPPPPG